MLHKISEYDRRLGLEIRLLNKKITDESRVIFDISNNYLTEYCLFHELTTPEVVNAINKFSSRYANDVQQFIETGKFPFQLNTHHFNLSRIEYDLFLISSFFFTEHRFLIANEIYNLPFNSEKTLFIGVGSGLELELLQDKTANMVAYDVSISKFTKARHQKVHFFEKEFTQEQEAYDTILAIELIEHVAEPYALISNIYDSLRDQGRFVVTTIKNVPQFDHLFNFESAAEFEHTVQDIGFEVTKKVTIQHKYRFRKIDACNTFYILTKS